ncbi:hypothetical protein FF38_03809 [Lucilia cuprina]|uniref:Uncharacterized protein n=1 Tax=Lucilia cuprina TaxID=7375 RepID=A0A0L0CKF1_LUCCU|nr:hypothetical protein CVS40_12515 [Lucilia cuprina]KNC32740.1 hypothetical protein FF38_03809 [Lucilia cuprina]
MDSLDKIKNLLDSCLLPQLQHDLDSIPIEREHFTTYHECLELQLPLLYDWIQQQPNIFVWNDEEKGAKLEIKTKLIVLLCEITSSNTIYQLNRKDLISNAERVLQNTAKLTNELDESLFKYYEDKLHKDKWKRQLGAVNGFVKYLEYRFNNALDHDSKMSQKFLMFCLSVALNVRTCYETHYKTLSTIIFLIMLQQGANDDIISMNIHSVIYDAVFKDISIMDSILFINKQWFCLIKCLDFYTNFDSFTWNYLDDMMEVLLRNISLAPDNAASMCLLKFINKLIVYFTLNHKEFEDFLLQDLRQMENLNECRLLANANTSYTCYRWAKSILQMFIIESHKLMQTIENAQQLLQEMHKIYILAILPIKLSVIETHLIIFLNKFIAVLMEVIKVHQTKPDIMPVITSLLETFNYHLNNSDITEKLQRIQQNLVGLLKTESFKKYTTI